MKEKKKKESKVIVKKPKNVDAEIGEDKISKDLMSSNRNLIQG